MFKPKVLALAALLLAITAAHAQKPLDKYLLVWDLPTQLIDGSPIVGDVFVKLYQCDAPIADNKTCSGDMQVFSIPAANAVNHDITYKPTNLVGNVYIRAAAHFGDTRESELSNMVSVPFDVRTDPMPIVNLQVQ